MAAFFGYSDVIGRLHGFLLPVTTITGNSLKGVAWAVDKKHRMIINKLYYQIIKENIRKKIFIAFQ